MYQEISPNLQNLYDVRQRQSKGQDAESARIYATPFYSNGRVITTDM